jgi:hypothetical protein
MSDTLRKGASREAWAASLRQLRGQDQPWPRWRAPRWTPRIAIVAVVGALFFAWGFLRIVLMLIFPRVVSY